MNHRLPWVIAGLAGTVWAQPPRLPAFEVASIRLASSSGTGDAKLARCPHFIHPGMPGGGLGGIQGNRFSERCVTLNDLITDAYGIGADQISGAPRWAGPDGDLYDVEAKAEGEGTPSPDQARAMLQTLLADRFQLKLHRETKNLPIYQLSIARNGPKLTEVPPDVQSPSFQPAADPASRRLMAPMPMIVALVAPYVDHPVVDKTGLTGSRYEYKWDIRELMQELAQGKPAPSIFSAVQDQLGLKLELKNQPGEIVAIDHAEKPSEN